MYSVESLVAQNFRSSLRLLKFGIFFSFFIINLSLFFVHISTPRLDPFTIIQSFSNPQPAQRLELLPHGEEYGASTDHNLHLPCA